MGDIKSAANAVGLHCVVIKGDILQEFVSIFHGHKTADLYCATVRTNLACGQT
jgi:hypothetical protein